MPDTPSHLLGVLNLRGSIMPIVDMRRRIGIASVEPSALTVIIVLSVEGDKGRRDFGLVVDGVSDVVDLPPEAIKDAPELSECDREHLISAIADAGERMILILISIECCRHHRDHTLAQLGAEWLGVRAFSELADI